MRYLLASLLCFTLFSSFFRGSEEEKALRQLHQNAESAFHKQDFATAKGAFKELLRRVGVRTTEKYRVEWPLYIDLAIRYTESCEGLGEYEEGKRALDHLLSNRPPKEFLLQIHLLRTRLDCRLKPPQEAYVEMRKIAEAPYCGTWGPHDLSYYHALEHALNAYYDDLFQKGKRLLLSGYFDKATLCYNEILIAIKKGYYPKGHLPDSLLEKKVRYRLAETYFKQANYEQSLLLLDSSETSEEQIDREMLYLAALCHKEKKEFERALELFETYAQSAELGEKSALNHYDQALFEIGLSYYKGEKDQKARTYFEKLTARSSPSPRSSILATIYLARLDLKEGRAQEVYERLDPTLGEISLNDPLRYECFYLKGEAAFRSGDFVLAKECFQESLPSNKMAGKWAHQALYNLALCHIRLGDQEKNLAFFQKGEELLKALLTTPKKELSALTLARLYLHLGKGEKIAPLLSESRRRFSDSGLHEATLLCAQVAPSYQEREAYYKEATDAHFQKLPLFPEAWYLRGLNHFQEGLTHSSANTPYFEQAISAFEQAFCCYESSDRKKAAQILKLEAKANFYRDAPLCSVAALKRLIENFSESMEEREETLYLLGLIASQLPDEASFTTAETSLKRILTDYPQGEYADNARHALGTLYFTREAFGKAKETFLQLAESSSDPLSVAEGWFWAAEAAEKEGENPSPLRENIYTSHLHSPRAAEAYFRQFPYQHYIEGNIEALAHLKIFPDRFPHSPLLVVVHTLVGMHEHSFSTAKTALENALESFSFCDDKEKNPGAAHVYFRYRAMIELAHLYLKHASEPEKAITLLERMLEEFADPDHEYASILTKTSPYPPIYEEGEYLLGISYLRLGKKGKAQALFTTMLSHYEEASIDQSPYLAHVWHEQGKMALSCKDFDTALNCFELADSSGEESLTYDEKLSLWMDQSECLKETGAYDKAMRLLSNVINADLASPLRLEAMHKRAELYELQQRPELAIRQLKTLAKKGSERAKEKLKVIYGIE